MTDTHPLPPGDPAYTVLIWRADSILLARLRPVIEALVAMADAACEQHHEYTCIDRGVGVPDLDYCWPCRLKLLRGRIYATTEPKGPATP